MRKDVVHKIAFSILVLAGALVMGGDSARAAELVMFEDPGCSWCRRWHAEVGPAYPLTAEGQAAPLRRIHIRDQATAGVLLERPITATPTFVLAEEGREIGRIVGYPGQEFFYGLLGNLLKSKPRASSITPIVDARIGHSLPVAGDCSDGVDCRGTSNGCLGTCWPRARSMTHIDRRIEWRHWDISRVHDRVRRLHTDIGPHRDARAV